jgi:hypothetical protein
LEVGEAGEWKDEVDVHLNIEWRAGMLGVVKMSKM